MEPFDTIFGVKFTRFGRICWFLLLFRTMYPYTTHMQPIYNRYTTHITSLVLNFRTGAEPVATWTAKQHATCVTCDLQGGYTLRWERWVERTQAEQAEEPSFFGVKHFPNSFDHRKTIPSQKLKQEITWNSFTYLHTSSGNQTSNMLQRLRWGSQQLPGSWTRAGLATSPSTSPSTLV